MKRRGRFVVEAAFLVPGICLLICYLVFATLYSHDYTVCAHTALECGTKGLYRDGSSDRQLEERIRRDLEQKLETRILWASEVKGDVVVNKTQIQIVVTADKGVWPSRGIEVRQTFWRAYPDSLIRMAGWLKE